MDDEAERGRGPFGYLQLQMIIGAVRRHVDVLIELLIAQIEVERDLAAFRRQLAGKRTKIAFAEQDG